METKEILVENVNGYKMLLHEKDHPITSSIKETGIWEPRTTQFIIDNLQAGQVFMDIGASVGYYSLLASGIVGHNGKVFSFEPLKRNTDLFLRNCFDNKIKNVVLFPYALSDVDNQYLKLYTGGAEGQSSLNYEAKSSEEVLVRRFDEINKKEGIMPDMIKIDVEGNERKVLEGMKEILETKRELTIVMEDYMGETADWLIENYGFKVITTERAYGNYILVKNQKNVKANPEPMTFHLLGTFQTPTNKKEGVGYAFCAKIMHLAKVLKYLGHYVIFYGAEGSEVECDEFVQVLSKDELPKEVWEHKYIEDTNHIANRLFNERTTAEIKARTSPYVYSRDILLIPTGSHQKPVADNCGLRLMAEMGIGYKGIFAENKVFESYTWMHWNYGFAHQTEGKFYDAVIPPIFDPEDFEYRAKKDDYFLFLGRIAFNKGVTIAKETCEAIGAKLKVAGIDYGMDIKSPNVEMVGFADLEKRKELISHAKAVFIPSIYIEPFGYIVIESAMSGTPVITTDYGAFVENVMHGKTGFRCRTLAQFMLAAKNIDKIKPKDCREWAMEFTLEKVAPMYQEYFEQLQNLYQKGWYALDKSQKDIMKIIKK